MFQLTKNRFYKCYICKFRFIKNNENKECVPCGISYAKKDEYKKLAYWVQFDLEDVVKHGTCVFISNC